MSARIGIAPRFFCFDLGSPLCWLAAERIIATIDGPVEWVPVSAAELPGAERFESFRCATEREVFQEEVSRRAAELQIAEPIRWPDPFPFDSAVAMRAAAYARSIGRTVAFALAAFRQAFQGGHALDEDFTLIAAAACEMHPQAVLAGIRSAAVARGLSEDAAHAAAHGVTDLPAVVIDGQAFVGERALEAAAAAAAASAAGTAGASAAGTAGASAGGTPGASAGGTPGASAGGASAGGTPTAPTGAQETSDPRAIIEVREAR